MQFFGCFITTPTPWCFKSISKTPNQSQRWQHANWFVDPLGIWETLLHFGTSGFKVLDIVVGFGLSSSSRFRSKDCGFAQSKSCHRQKVGRWQAKLGVVLKLDDAANFLKWEAWVNQMISDHIAADVLHGYLHGWCSALHMPRDNVASHNLRNSNSVPQKTKALQGRPHELLWRHVNFELIWQKQHSSQWGPATFLGPEATSFSHDSLLAVAGCNSSFGILTSFSWRSWRWIVAGKACQTRLWALLLVHSSSLINSPNCFELWSRRFLPNISSGTKFMFSNLWMWYSNRESSVWSRYMSTFSPWWWSMIYLKSNLLQGQQTEICGGVAQSTLCQAKCWRPTSRAQNEVLAVCRCVFLGHQSKCRPFELKSLHACTFWSKTQRSKAAAQLGHECQWTSSFVSVRPVAESKWDGFVASFLLQSSMRFKGGQIRKERPKRFLGDRMELLSDACLSVRALSQLVMVCSNNCDSMAAYNIIHRIPGHLRASFLWMTVSDDTLRMTSNCWEPDVFGFRRDACVSHGAKSASARQLGHGVMHRCLNVEWRSILSKMSFVTCRDRSSDWISVYFNHFQSHNWKLWIWATSQLKAKPDTKRSGFWITKLEQNPKTRCP